MSLSKLCKNNQSISYLQRKQGKVCDLYTGIWEQNKEFYLKSTTLKKFRKDFQRIR